MSNKACTVSEFEKELIGKCNFKNTNDHQFLEKYPVIATLPYFKNTLMAISVIHEFGAWKYAFYSWQNTAHLSDSFSENSLDAAHRHLVRYRLDSLLDESGINHAGHIACRGGSMYLTRFYRTIMNRTDFYREKTREDNSRKCVMSLVKSNYDITNLIFLDQISPEVRLSMLKFKPEYTPSSKDVAIDILDEAISRALVNDIDPNFDPYNDICWADIILWTSAYLVNCHTEIVEQCDTYIKSLSKVEKTASKKKN